MTKTTIGLFFLFISLVSFSQSLEQTPTYRVSLNDLKMDAYPKDSTANALVLFEFGKSYVDPDDFDLRTEKKT